MNKKEERLLSAINDSACRTRESMRQSIAGRINSYILIVSFIALAEATISAALIGAIASHGSALWVRISSGVMIFCAFVLLGIAALLLCRLFSETKAIAHSPDARYLPYCHDGLVKRGLDDLTLEERSSLFGIPLSKQGSDYSNLDYLYRMWVYENTCATEEQFQIVLSATKRFKVLTILTIVSSVALASGALVVVFFG